MERKISTCINVRINVGNYQHIEIVKYAEESAIYDSESQRIEKEDQLTKDVFSDLHRSMTIIAEGLGKGKSETVSVTESIKKAIPEWIAKNPVPNIANSGKKLEIKVAAEEKNKKDTREELVAEAVTPQLPKSTPTKEAVTESTQIQKQAEKDDIFDDLFE